MSLQIYSWFTSKFGTKIWKWYWSELMSKVLYYIIFKINQSVTKFILFLLSFLIKEFTKNVVQPIMQLIFRHCPNCDLFTLLSTTSKIFHILAPILTGLHLRWSATGQRKAVVCCVLSVITIYLCRDSCCSMCLDMPWGGCFENVINARCHFHTSDLQGTLIIFLPICDLLVNTKCCHNVQLVYLQTSVLQSKGRQKYDIVIQVLH